NRPRQGKTVRGSCRQRAHRLRRRCQRGRGRASAAGPQGEPRGRGRGVNVVGLLLAGGQSRRMGGGYKALRLLGGIPLLDRIIERLRPQVDKLVLNANGDPARFAGYELPVVADSVAGFAGLLAGVWAGLDWAASLRPDCPYIASVATDAPFLPTDLVRRLASALDAAQA